MPTSLPRRLLRVRGWNKRVHIYILYIYILRVNILLRRLVEAMEEGEVSAAWQQKKQESPTPETQDSIYGNRLPYQAFFHFIDNAKLIETLFTSGRP